MNRGEGKEMREREWGGKRIRNYFSKSSDASGPESKQSTNLLLVSATLYSMLGFEITFSGLL